MGHDDALAGSGRRSIARGAVRILPIRVYGTAACDCEVVSANIVVARRVTGVRAEIGDPATAFVHAIVAAAAQPDLRAKAPCREL